MNFIKFLKVKPKIIQVVYIVLKHRFYDGIMILVYINTIADLLTGTLPDGGPVYTETDTSRFIVEPWNAFSSLFIMVPAIIWLIKIRREQTKYQFIFMCIPLMILGGLGSTIFHAFRASEFFLVMDVLPSALLSVVLSLYFWIKVLRKWWLAVIIIVLSLASRMLLWDTLPMTSAINFSYAITGVVTALPMLIILFRTSFRNWEYVGFTIAFFILALVLREQDPYPYRLLPMGTHFLWHIFTGFGAYTILAYLYGFRNRELQSIKK